MSKELDEIHRIREEIYEEEKRMSASELLKKIKEESEKFMRKYKMHLRQPTEIIR